jgi:hypothetical protein
VTQGEGAGQREQAHALADNRPVEVSRREWSSAQAAEGRRPVARMLASAASTATSAPARGDRA